MLLISWRSILDYLAAMTKFEYDGYCTLLQYLRKKLKTKQRHEVVQKINDPEGLLKLFEVL